MHCGIFASITDFCALDASIKPHAISDKKEMSSDNAKYPWGLTLPSVANH